MVPVVTPTHAPARLPVMAATLLVMSGGQVLAQTQLAVPSPAGTPRAVSSQAASPQVGAPVPLLVPPQSHQQTATTSHSAAGNAPAGGSGGTVDVPDLMTDSPAYCAKLSNRVDEMARGDKTPAEAAEMAREGQRLCDTGKTRNGIQHLRRAFIMLRDNRE